MAADEGSAAVREPGYTAPMDLEGYSLEAQLGDRAAGPVYLARQRRPERRVVLRMLPRRLSDERRLARMRHEVGQLLRIDHPGIARLLAWDKCRDAGGEHPFLVSECIEGRPLPAWCERESLDVAGRMQLVAKVARTIHALHSRGIVHGALLGHNVLVTACGETKVLDAGLGTWRSPRPALALAGAGGEATGEDAGAGPGGHPLDDPAADIHALGVLAGQLVAEAANVLPPGDGAAARIPTDLRAVLARAIAPPGGTVYPSSLELAQDLENWLARRPVVARQPSPWQAARLFAWRHRMVTAATVLLVAGAAGTLGFALHLGVDQRAALARAQARAQELAAANRFLGNALLNVDHPGGGTRADSVRSVLDQAREQLLAAQDMPDAVDIRLRALLGETYSSLGDTATGLPMQEEALERADAAQDIDPALRKLASIGLARTLANGGQATRAVRLMKPFLADPAGGDQDSRLAWVRVRCVLTQASIALADADAAERYNREVGGLAEQWLGPMAEPALNVRADRVMISYMREHYRDVLVAAQKLSNDIARNIGTRHPVRLNMLALAGLGAREMDDIPLARRLFQEAAQVSAALYGADAARTLDNQRRVAEIDHDLHPTDRAPVAELRRVMLAETSQRGPAGAGTLAATVAYASAALDLADPASQAEGERLLQETVDAMASGSMARNLSSLRAEFALARWREQTGHASEALRLYRDVRASASQALGPRHQLVFRSGTATAQLLEHLRLQGEARQEYAGLLPLLREAYGEKDPRTRQVAQRLSALGTGVVQ